ncbi:MAG: quinone-dependent dihydroorotate dehydrogenase [Acidiferrobacteraceae bacterium]
MRSNEDPSRLRLPQLVYRALRPILFQLEPERAHEIAFAVWEHLRNAPVIGPALARLMNPPKLPVQLMGLSLPNPVGLAAGLDKDGRYVAGLALLGFGWLELGTVTPLAQAGNPRPRLFRLVRDRALINRMGFNNEGASALAVRLAERPPTPVIGVNIGKNRDTPIEHAADDYLAALRLVYPVSDYVTINVSSPNTPGLRVLQRAEHLAALLRVVKEEQARLADASGRYVPLAVKLAPEPEGAIETLGQVLRETAVDGVIATNTTLARPGLAPGGPAAEAGGLSGSPLRPLATEMIRQLRRILPPGITLIGAGGISSTEDAWERLMGGADAVQIYTGLIFEGPGLPSELVRGLRKKVLGLGTTDLAHALRAARSDCSSRATPDLHPS